MPITTMLCGVQLPSTGESHCKHRFRLRFSVTLWPSILPLGATPPLAESWATSSHTTTVRRGHLFIHSSFHYYPTRVKTDRQKDYGGDSADRNDKSIMALPTRPKLSDIFWKWTQLIPDCASHRTEINEKVYQHAAFWSQVWCLLTSESDMNTVSKYLLLFSLLNPSNRETMLQATHGDQQ